MNMSIEEQREPLNPCTLIALKIISDFMGEVLKKGNLEDAKTIVDTERAFRVLEEKYLTDLLWGRLDFRLTDTNPKPSIFPPILDILQICSDARIRELRCDIYLTDQEKHEYLKTVSMGYHRMIKQILPDGPTEERQEISLGLWGKLEEGALFTNLGESDHLCTSIITARQEVIGRDHHKDMSDNPHKDPVIDSTEKFVEYTPIRLLFMSAPKKIHEAFTEVLDQYLIDFQKKKIDWSANILSWNRQTVTLFSILSRKQQIYEDSFWFSPKDFNSIDPLILDGYKPIETLLVLSRQGRIDVHEADRVEGSSAIRLLIRMNINVEPKRTSVKDTPNEKEVTDEAQKAAIQYVPLNAKKKILAQITLDNLPLQDEQGIITIDPAELIASVPSFSKRGLHDLCQLMVKEGYFKKADDHYPRAKLEPNPWNYVGPREKDPFDRIVRISILPNIEQLERLAFLSPVDKELSAKTVKTVTTDENEEIVTINEVVVNLSRQRVTFMGIMGEFTLGKLPWQILRQCATSEPDGLGKISLEHIGKDEDTVSKTLNRINSTWSPTEMRIVSMKGGYVYIEPKKVSAM